MSTLWPTGGCFLVGLVREARSVLRAARRGSDTATATAHGHRLTLHASVAMIASTSAARVMCLEGLPAKVGAVAPLLVRDHASHR